nr:hypothetical protein Iba_chr04cCG13480 [Ipomoea batatas]
MGRQRRLQCRGGGVAATVGRQRQRKRVGGGGGKAARGSVRLSLSFSVSFPPTLPRRQQRPAPVAARLDELCSGVTAPWTSVSSLLWASTDPVAAVVVDRQRQSVANAAAVVPTVVAVAGGISYYYGFYQSHSSHCSKKQWDSCQNALI